MLCAKNHAKHVRCFPSGPHTRLGGLAPPLWVSTERSDNLPKAYELKKLWSIALFFHQRKIKPGRQIRGTLDVMLKMRTILWAMRKQRRFWGSAGTSCYEGRYLGRSAWCQGCAGVCKGGSLEAADDPTDANKKQRRSEKHSGRNHICGEREADIQCHLQLNCVCCPLWEPMSLSCLFRI